jgi:hypothetical protein
VVCSNSPGASPGQVLGGLAPPPPPRPVQEHGQVRVHGVGGVSIFPNQTEPAGFGTPRGNLISVARLGYICSRRHPQGG